MAGGSRLYQVLLTRGAEQDLESIHGYLCEADNPASAGRLLDRLMDVIDGLARFPERGAHPKELAVLGIRDYRQAVFKPWRVVYRVIGDRVVVYLIVDGRRDMQTVLARRLLGA
ncbi:MAG: type II toxin-antitoxin system RelE/ParE family toxin [Rhodocyclaceae bacterium]|nr:type II toxin-antitoxin system RelE/ParE family toxin [Rhodocyclaceae bacterium]MCA3074792.1 type II toxin-antitoxin system RelE/ParE family toxin [Rhodocyclaceae bacterium]MCA3088533.1 type II toxin-antitoxin system RelE/ParE family toxin [Rhodocyclaceae bacterium]MCA3094433.1 type II toxin-antitoxin system RelE/ParE family toxin [Rhodocyclaceae bacterium]MCA3099989.1 type II toxin-antitoxin system RelE/ParE family toxin [Rhodocyclaceae bacterium]